MATLFRQLIQRSQVKDEALHDPNYQDCLYNINKDYPEHCSLILGLFCVLLVLQKNEIFMIIFLTLPRFSFIRVLSHTKCFHVFRFICLQSLPLGFHRFIFIRIQNLGFHGFIFICVQNLGFHGSSFMYKTKVIMGSCTKPRLSWVLVQNLGFHGFIFMYKTQVFIGSSSFMYKTQVFMGPSFMYKTQVFIGSSSCIQSLGFHSLIFIHLKNLGIIILSFIYCKSLWFNDLIFIHVYSLSFAQFRITIKEVIVEYWQLHVSTQCVHVTLFIDVIKSHVWNILSSM